MNIQVRNGESSFQTYFRSERFVQVNGQWHFLTREKTVEGPFSTQVHAEQALIRYITALECGVFSDEQKQRILKLQLAV